jgi:hypothetical protein
MTVSKNPDHWTTGSAQALSGRACGKLLSQGWHRPMAANSVVDDFLIIYFRSL